MFSYYGVPVEGVALGVTPIGGGDPGGVVTSLLDRWLGVFMSSFVLLQPDTTMAAIAIINTNRILFIIFPVFKYVK
jgi:hypothetical protein